jgi:hypothetical protein
VTAQAELVLLTRLFDGISALFHYGVCVLGDMWQAAACSAKPQPQ